MDSSWINIGSFSLKRSGDSGEVVCSFPGAVVVKPAVIRVSGDWEFSRAVALGAFDFESELSYGDLFVQKEGDPILQDLGSKSYVSSNPRAEISFFWPTVEREIFLGGTASGIHWETDLISSLGILKLLDKNPMHLSGGEAAKLILASHLVRRPKVVVVDRILGELDAVARSGLISFFDRYPIFAAIVIIDEISLGREGWRWDIRGDTVAIWRSEFSDDEESRDSMALRSPELQIHALVTNWDNVERLEMERLEVTKLLIGREGVSLLPPLSFSVGRGCWIWVTGPNGSGKTTLFETLIGLVKPISGSASWVEDGRVSSLSSRVSYSPQEPDDDVTEINFMDEILASAAWRDYEDPAKEAQKWLRHFKVEDSVMSSSLNEDIALRKLASLFSALARNREIIIVDEPSLFLSRIQKGWIASALLESVSRERKMILCATHDLPFFKMINDSLLSMGAKAEQV